MSNQQHKNALFNDMEPVFPVAIKQLQRSMTLHHINTRMVIKDVAQLVSHFVEEIKNPVTSDGYDWFCGLKFTVANEDVYLLIPKDTDNEARDGVKSDRMPAFYCLDDFATVYAMVICTELNEAVYTYAKNLNERR